jgi:hypothetical protein
MVLADKESSLYSTWLDRFKKTKGKYNGKKYNTLRGYIMAIDFAERKELVKLANN